MNGQIESKNVLQVNIGMDVIYVIMIWPKCYITIEILVAIYLIKQLPLIDFTELIL